MEELTIKERALVKEWAMKANPAKNKDGMNKKFKW